MSEDPPRIWWRTLFMPESRGSTPGVAGGAADPTGAAVGCGADDPRGLPSIQVLPWVGANLCLLMVERLSRDAVLLATPDRWCLLRPATVGLRLLGI